MLTNDPFLTFHLLPSPSTPITKPYTLAPPLCLLSPLHSLRLLSLSLPYSPPRLYRERGEDISKAKAMVKEGKDIYEISTNKKYYVIKINLDDAF